MGVTKRVSLWWRSAGAVGVFIVAACAAVEPAVVADATIPRPAPPRTEAPVLNGAGGDLDGEAGSADPAAPAESATTVSASAPTAEVTADSAVALQTASGIVVPIRGGRPGAWLVGTPCFEEAEVATGELLGSVRVMIDPGHGGADEPGAVGPNGLTEADLNLDVAERVVELLVAAGISTGLTRTADYRMAIVARAELVLARQPEIFISIHHNGGPVTVSDTPGTEIFHQIGSDESERLGGLIFDEITTALSPFADRWAASEFQGVLARQNRDGEDLYGVLRRTTDVVSVLTEALYLSEPTEATLLAESDVVQAEAAAIARAVVRYLESDDEGGGHLDDHTFTGRLGGGGGTAGCVDPPLD